MSTCKGKGISVNNTPLDVFTDPKEGVGIYRVEHRTQLGEDPRIRSKHFRNVKNNVFLYALKSQFIPWFTQQSNRLL